MNDIDILGKTITCFEFKNDPKLNNYDKYTSMIGLSAVVKSIHNTYPEYANCRVTFSNGTTQYWHYPTELIKQQLQQAEEDEKPVDLDAILLQIKNLTP